MDLKTCHELWSMCGGPEGVGEGRGLSLTGSRSTGQRLPSAGADWTAVLHTASPWGGRRCSHTVQAVSNAFLSPHPVAGDCEHAGGAGSVFFRPDGRCQCDSLCRPSDERLSCVSWIPPDPLVELYHWLQGEGTGGLVTSR